MEFYEECYAYASFTIDHLDKSGKLSSDDKNYLDTLVVNSRGTNVSVQQDPDFTAKLREAYETISKLERKNLYFIDILKNMKTTYDFFEFSSDEKVLHDGVYEGGVIYKPGEKPATTPADANLPPRTTAQSPQAVPQQAS